MRFLYRLSLLSIPFKNMLTKVGHYINKNYDKKSQKDRISIRDKHNAFYGRCACAAHYLYGNNSAYDAVRDKSKTPADKNS